MGIKLIVEIMDWAADKLTATEWKALVILAEDANDKKRMTWSSVTDPKITKRVGLTPEAWTNLRGVLVRKGVLEVDTPGKRGQVAKYRFPNYAPMGHETHGETEPMGHEIHDPSESMPHETDDQNGKRVMGSMTPTPPCSSTPSSAPTGAPAAGGGGGDDLQEQAAEFLENLPGRWGVGRATARKLGPLLLEAVVRQGWDLDGELTAKLTEDLGPVTRYVGALTYRINDLPKKPTVRTRASPPEAELPPWCEHRDCNPTDRHRTTEDTQGFRTTTPCRACHPDHTKDRAA